MEELKIIKMRNREVTQHLDQSEKSDPLKRFKAVTRDLTEKVLEVINRISINEMSKSQPQAELVEDYYLLYHYLDFLKRLASSKK
jgi:hypothetical protein